jgi:phosphoesterase RecJ-like protein
LLKALLNSARFDCDDRVASFSLSLETAKNLAVLPEDNEGLIDHLRAVEGVQVAAFFEELPENKVRVSMRSKEPRFDVCKICALFGGGGHPQAAGARLVGSLESAEEKVLEAIGHEVRSHD